MAELEYAITVDSRFLGFRNTGDLQEKCRFVLCSRYNCNQDVYNRCIP